MGTFSRLCAAVMVDEGEEFGVEFENRRIFTLTPHVIFKVLCELQQLRCTTPD